MANDFICGERLLPCFLLECNLIYIFTNFARVSGSFSSAFSSAFSSLLYFPFETLLSAVCNRLIFLTCDCVGL